jgi:hypothetical protein
MSFPDDRPTARDSSVQLSVIHFVDRELEKERGLTVEKLERLREVILGRLAAMDEARHVADQQLNGHLSDLNHKAEERAHNESQFQSREGFQQFFEDYGKWRDSVNNTLSQQAGRSASWVAIVGVAFALLQIVLRFWK